MGKGASESGGFEWLVKLFGDYALMICCHMIIGGLLMDYMIIFAYLGIIGYNLLIS